MGILSDSAFIIGILAIILGVLAIILDIPAINTDVAPNQILKLNIIDLFSIFIKDL